VLAAGVATLAIALVERHALEGEARSRNEEVDRGPFVRVARAELSPATRQVRLTADVRGFFQTTMYAKISGYVRDVRVDKGDHVTRGQVLGSVESPETDEAVASAQYTASLQRKVRHRADVLAPDVLAEQDLDTANSNLGVSDANVRGALAIKHYEVLRAPFDGVVTARYVDPGALMPAATGSTQSALPFVDLARTDVVRVDVYVSQDVAPFVRVGDPVTVWQDERPSVRVEGKVSRTAGGLDPRTRTMLVEAQIDNREVGFLPGTFATVLLEVAAERLPTVPSEALVVRAGKSALARVVDGHVEITPIDVGPTDGRKLRVLRGIQAGDVVALDLPVDVPDGAPVQPVGTPPASPDGQHQDGGADAR
jgi:RND family efflux transporter MFP subunit